MILKGLLKWFRRTPIIYGPLAAPIAESMDRADLAALEGGLRKHFCEREEIVVEMIRIRGNQYELTLEGGQHPIFEI